MSKALQCVRAFHLAGRCLLFVIRTTQSAIFLWCPVVAAHSSKSVEDMAGIVLVLDLEQAIVVDTIIVLFPIRITEVCL